MPRRPIRAAGEGPPGIYKHWGRRETQRQREAAGKTGFLSGRTRPATLRVTAGAASPAPPSGLRGGGRPRGLPRGRLRDAGAAAAAPPTLPHPPAFTALSCRSPRSAVWPPPAEEEERRRRWRQPPARSTLTAAIARLLPAPGALRRCRKAEAARGAALRCAWGRHRGRGRVPRRRRSRIRRRRAAGRGSAPAVRCRRSARGAAPGRAADPLAGAAGG